MYIKGLFKKLSSVELIYNKHVLRGYQSSKTSVNDVSNQVSGFVPTSSATLHVALLNLVQALVPFQTTLALMALKLDQNNFTISRSLVLPAIRAHDLDGFLTSTRPCPAQFLQLQSREESLNGVSTSQVRINPEYSIWMRIDQAIMTWLLSSISESMLGHVV